MWLSFFLVEFFSCSNIRVQASTELDRKYTVTRVGVLRVYDNAGGFFAEHLAPVFKQYFTTNQSRFVYQDISRAEGVISQSGLPYQRVIDDPAILNRVAQAMDVQALIRTRLVKEADEYHVTLDWLLTPQMTLLATESFNWNEKRGNAGGLPVEGDGISGLRDEIQAALVRLVKKMPFLGMVTGRDQNQVTVNLGKESGLKAGDVLMIGTIEEAKRHPIFNSIVDWRFAPTGKVLIESVDENLVFGSVLEEEAGKKINRYQKILTIIPKPAEPTPTEPMPGEPVDASSQPPKLGWLSASIAPGLFSRQATLSTGAGKTGGGLIFTGAADGQLWLTRQFFAEAGFGYGFWSHSQSDIADTGAAASTSVSGTTTRFRLAAGYTLLMTDDFYGPKAALKLGYQSTSYSLPVSTTELTGGLSLGVVYVGVTAELPLRDKWGALFGLDFGILKSASDTSTVVASTDSTMHAAFFLGGYYRMMPRMTLRVGFDVLIQGANDASGASISQKIISLAPALLYYF